MKSYNFELISCDTDAITICKQDMGTFNKEEIFKLTKELNSLFPDGIGWEFEFNAPVMIVLKAKNYLVVDEKGKWKIKGSALKSSTLEPALKDMIHKMLKALVDDRQEELSVIYLEMIRNIRDRNIDIKQWAKKMQLSPTTFNSTRSNETKVVDAIKGTDYKSGDRIYVYPAEGDILRLLEHFNNDYDQDKFYKKVFKATERFASILPVKEMFVNYSLKRNKQALTELT